MSKMTGALAFIAGLVVGGGATWFYIQDKYARIAEEEIDSVKAVYAKREAEKPFKCEETCGGEGEASVLVTERAAKKESITEYAKRLQKEGYTDYSKTVSVKEPSKGIPGGAPYVISPEEFGEIEEYTKISLTFYDEDGILADEDNEVIGSVAEIVGDALDHFGEYEADSVFARNDAKRCDYEILKDVRAYSDVLDALPPQHEED